MKFYKNYGRIIYNQIGIYKNKVNKFLKKENKMLYIHENNLRNKINSNYNNKCKRNKAIL